MTPKIESGYARAADGAYIAYQVFGQGPVDIAWQLGRITNLEVEWDWHVKRSWYEGLSSFARVILHDRRGTGNSSRNVPAPNLETRAADLRAVLDELASTSTVVGGWFESASPAALLAATEPDRVRAIAWWNPIPCSIWKPDYPWGMEKQEVELELRALDVWGTDAYGEAWAELFEAATGSRPTRDDIRYQNRVARSTCTPDVARAMSFIEWETDVRQLMPALKMPVLLIAGHPRYVAASEYVASLISGSRLIIPDPWEWPRDRREADEAVRPYLNAIQDFLGVQSPRRDLDSVVTTVLFTDIVDSTALQARLGDRAWRDLIERHHAVVRGLLEAYRGQEQDTAGDGFYARFDGPARAIRCAREITEAVRDLGVQIRAGVHTG